MSQFSLRRGVMCLPGSQQQLLRLGPRRARSVGQACHCLAMTTRRCLRGTELRYVLTHHLFLHGSATVVELIDMLDWHGFETRGRPSKAISDALRWEMGRGRVCRRGRGLYVPVWMPRGTEHRIHARVLALRAEAERWRRGSA